MSLNLVPLNNIPLIRHGDDLADIILNAARTTNFEIQENDIFVLAQKIVSKSEGRMIDLANVTPSPHAKEYSLQVEKDPRLIELILSESKEVLRARKDVMIVEHRLGFVCANAGIDHSNVNPDENLVLLLPEDPDASAKNLRNKIKDLTGKNTGIMIIDSHGRAWRNGTVGVCIGLSGIPGLIDERGWQDLFGYTLKATVVGVADELAAAASLVMGQAAEGTPVVHVRGFPYPPGDGSLKELIRPREMDMFR